VTVLPSCQTAAKPDRAAMIGPWGTIGCLHPLPPTIETQQAN
jgi:hypothetical protein